MSDEPLTARQEAFCHAHVELNNGCEAYLRVYSIKNRKQATEEACKLLAKPNITQRIKELRKPVLEALGVTLTQHLEDLRMIRDKALADGKWGPAVMAEMGRGKASGLHITKIEDVTDPLKKALANMPADKAQAMIDALEQMQAIQAKAAKHA